MKSEGLKKIRVVKNPTIKLLENMQENEFERLRRIKSTDILGGNNKTENCMIKNWSK